MKSIYFYFIRARDERMYISMMYTLKFERDIYQTEGEVTGEE